LLIQQVYFSKAHQELFFYFSQYYESLIFFSVKLNNLGDKHRLYTELGLRNSGNEFDPDTRGQQRKITIGDEFIVDRNTTMRFAISNVNNSAGELSQSKFLIDASLQRKVFNDHSITLLYRQEPHNYTVDLIESNIIMSHAGGTYSFGRQGLPGIYVQYLHTDQTDDNARNLLFASAFYSLREFPTVKVGANFLRFSFDKQKPELYFSPDQYENVELFAEFSNIANPKNDLTYRVFGALGRQEIEDNDGQFTRRIELDLGYRFHPNLNGILYYRHSNAAQSTATGFTFDQLGVRLAYLFYRK